MYNRKHYIDNLRWACILLLVPFHSAMAWNSWGEGNYIWFNAEKGLSTFIIIISPWYMSLLFVIAGMIAGYSLEKRSYSQFIKERIVKLLVPSIAGMLTVVPVMTYYADRFHNEYGDGFLSHYKVFFTKFTTLTGYDGGFTPAHLWFLLLPIPATYIMTFLTTELVIRIPVLGMLFGRKKISDSSKRQ